MFMYVIQILSFFYVLSCGIFLFYMIFDLGVVYYFIFEKWYEIGGNYIGGVGDFFQKWVMGLLNINVDC